jgi:hypothetical protein
VYEEMYEEVVVRSESIGTVILVDRTVREDGIVLVLLESAV